MSFAIERFTDVLVRSVNIRAEMHGSDPVPALDVGLRLIGSNNLLLLLDPPLKRMLYKAADGDDAEPELDGVDPATDLPELRSSVLDMPIALKREYTGMALEIDYGLGGKRNIKVADCEANNFKVEAKEGGTVEIDFRVQASGVDGVVLGQIGALVRHDVRVTLTGPALQDDDSRGDPANPFKHSVKPDGGIVDNHPTGPDAGDIFGEWVAATELDKTELPRAPAKKTASFKARAKAALNKAATKAAAKKKATGQAARP